MRALERLARAGDRLFDRFRHHAAFDLTEATAVDGHLASLQGHDYAVLVTFRRNGEPVPSPVWFGVDRVGRAYVKTAEDVGKVKRIHGNNRVLIAPCTARGKPTGPAVRATARLLPPERWGQAEAALTAAYGIGRGISERFLTSTGPVTYLEISPRSTDQAPD